MKNKQSCGQREGRLAAVRLCGDWAEQDVVSVTRIYALPRPDLADDIPTTPRQQEIRRIRRILSLQAARLTQKPERVRECAQKVREALHALERLTEGGLKGEG